MTSEMAVIAIQTILAIAGLWLLLTWLYFDYQVDSFRHNLFVLRGNLFNEVANGCVSFDHPAYGMLRSTINGYIRGAHRVSLFSFLIFLLLTGKIEFVATESFTHRFKAKLSDLGLKDRETLLKYKSMMDFLIVKHLILSSPMLLLTTLIPVAVMMKTTDYIKSVLNRFDRQIDQMDTAAMASGDNG